MSMNIEYEKKRGRECKWCGEKVGIDGIVMKDIYNDAQVHYFCNEDCAKEWLLSNADWEYIDEENE